jgi:ABC-2 type transport system permease protein
MKFSDNCLPDPLNLNLIKMNLIYKVAKTELRNLFYSPIAWFLTIAFFVQCAITYTKLLGNFATSQEMGGIQLAELSQLTGRIFTSSYGFFPPIMQNLYLYLPLLTMGLISREINAGTISLLYSSPVKIREIVFGKFTAMLIYNLILVLCIGVFMIAGILDIKSADWSMLLSASLGFYLLLAAYSAIGLFMSSLTSYQVVAAISTFVMIGILSYIGTLWQGIDFVRDLTYFLSLSGRTQHMLRGLISTKDVLYFIIIVSLFLSFSICKLKFAREAKSWPKKTAAYLLISICALFIGYFSSRPNFIAYWDTTADNTNTLTPTAQEIIKELGDEPLQVTIYNNFLDDHSLYGLPEQRNFVLEQWEPYLRFKPNITFQFVNYYDRPLALNYDMFKFYPGKTMPQIVAQNAKASGFKLSLFKTPAQISKIIDLKPELNRFVMQLSYKGKTTFLRVFNDQLIWPSETEVSAAFKRLLQADMPKIGFISGAGERNPYKKGDRAYKLMASDKTFRFSLINQGFDIDTISIDKQEIPENITALVLADPLKSLSNAAIQKLSGYIDKGGNLLIAGEPGRQQMINPLLNKIGVRFTDGMLEEKDDDNAPWLMLPRITPQGILLSKSLDKPSIDTLPVSLTGAAALTYTSNGFEISPLLKTKSASAHNTNIQNPDLALTANDVAGNSNTAAPQTTTSLNVVGKLTVLKPTLVKLNGADRHNSQKADSGMQVPKAPGSVYTTAISLTRKVNGKDQRIVISGDADFMSNTELNRYEPRTSNFFFVAALFSWLDHGKFPIDTSRPDARDNRLTVSTDRVALLKIWYIWVLPAILLLGGSVLLIRRRRK